MMVREGVQKGGFLYKLYTRSYTSYSDGTMLFSRFYVKKLSGTNRESIAFIGNEHFCLIWQPVVVTISRRSAADDCADAQRLRQQGGKRIACTFCASRTLC